MKQSDKKVSFDDPQNGGSFFMQKTDVACRNLHSKCNLSNVEGEGEVSTVCRIILGGREGKLDEITGVDAELMLPCGTPTAAEALASSSCREWAV